MILPYSTQFKDGTPTYFIQKIWAGMPIVLENWQKLRHEKAIAYFEKFGRIWDEEFAPIHPKVTTIREDVHDRWKPGMKIHMVVFNRSKNQFQFVPTLVCKSVQDIYMTNIHGYEISIDDTYQYSIDQIARNDGFKDSEDMRNYFFPEGSVKDAYAGKIIHWTTLTY